MLKKIAFKTFIFVGIITVMGISSTASSYGNNKNSPIVDIPDQGSIKGAENEGIVAFKGIPYALPPINENRWLPPQPYPGWSGIKEAVQFASNCQQKPNSWDTSLSKEHLSEDCLYLNIWAPKDFINHQTNNGYPVMVWIHGGGLVNGGTSLPLYDGSNLARQNIVVVTINYRLGRFGFFAFPALHKESEEQEWANYGLMDQIAALQWIKKSISSFGGNSNNITLFGESAGGDSILALMTTPEANKLFNKAIIQSGTSNFSLLSPRPWQQAVAIAQKFAEKHGIHGIEKNDLANLRKLPAEAILDGLNLENMQRDLFSGIVIDGVLLRQSIKDAFKDGNFQPIPILIGANDGDGVFFNKTDLNILAKQLGTTTQEIKHVYDPENKLTDNKILHQVTADWQFIQPTHALARQLSKFNVPVYEYRFSYVAKPARPYTSYGAPHASELPFVFDNLKAAFKNIEPQDTAMAKAVSTYWVNFARSEVPTAGEFPAAPKFDVNNPKLLHFTLQGPIVESDPFQKRLDFIEQLQNKKTPPMPKKN